MMLAYAIAIIAAGALTLTAKRLDVAFGWCAIFFSWAAWCCFIIVSGIYDPWYAGIIFDGATVVALQRHPSSQMKAVLSAIFLVQILEHITYGGVILFRGSADRAAYLAHLSYTGWAELLVLGGWAGGSTWRRFMRGRHLVRPPINTQSARNMGGEADGK
jgi:hypothetical protein